MMLNAVISLMGDNYDVDAKAYFARRSVALSSSEKAAYNKFFVDVKAKFGATSIASLFDVLYIMRGNKTDAFLNLAKNAHNGSEVGTLTYSTTLGPTGAPASYINTNYNPSTQGVTFTQNDGSFGYYDRTSSSNNVRLLGVNDGVRQIAALPREGLVTFAAINGGLASKPIAAAAPGHIWVTRTNSTQFNVYQNGSVIGTPIASVSGSIPSLNMYVFTLNTSGVAGTTRGDQVPVFYMGRGNLEINDELTTLATTLGFNI